MRTQDTHRQHIPRECCNKPQHHVERDVRDRSTPAAVLRVAHRVERERAKRRQPAQKTDRQREVMLVTQLEQALTHRGAEKPKRKAPGDVCRQDAVAERPTEHRRSALVQAVPQHGAQGTSDRYERELHKHPLSVPRSKKGSQMRKALALLSIYHTLDRVG